MDIFKYFIYLKKEIKKNKYFLMDIFLNILYI